jgi:DNA-binding response OmpR family regulator
LDAPSTATIDINVVVVAPAGQVSDQIWTRLREAGVSDENVRRVPRSSPEVWLPQVDVLVLINDPNGTAGAVERLRSWRSAGLKAPILTIADADDSPHLLDAGADDSVAKTVTPTELASRLKALARRGGVKQSTLQVDDLHIDMTTKSVQRGGRSIALTPREYDILEFLARYRGQVVTRKMIWQRLYGEVDGRASNIVDVYIRYLRQKIDKGFSRPLIRTHWGRGYMLADGEVEPTT